MEDLSKARNLSPAEVDELRAEVKVASAALDEARRELIGKEKRIQTELKIKRNVLSLVRNLELLLEEMSYEINLCFHTAQ